jgi:hypothetical protein
MFCLYSVTCILPNAFKGSVSKVHSTLLTLTMQPLDIQRITEQPFLSLLEIGPTAAVADKQEMLSEPC